METKIYNAMTIFDDNKDNPRLIQWYCPERLKPLANCQELITDYHLCPDEPEILSDLEYRIYNDLLTEEEKKKYLTPLEPDDPEYIEGVNLSKEELELWYNHRYSKDELIRAINGFFTEKEIVALRQYLQEKYGFPLSAEELDFPMSNFLFQSYCIEHWDIDKEPDYILHKDPGFPLYIPVEGFLEKVHVINANITITVENDGQLRFRFDDKT